MSYFGVPAVMYPAVIPGTVGAVALRRTRAIPDPYLYYVYVWYDPRSGSPIYVGKGTDKCASAPKFRRAHRKRVVNNQLLARMLRAMRRDGFEREVRIHCCFIEEWAAFAGTLCNLTAGGEGSPDLGPKALRILSRKTAASWNNSEIRKAKVDGIHRNALDSVWLANLSAKAKVRGADPAERKRRSTRAVTKWADPGFKKVTGKKISKALMASVTGRQSISDKAKLRWSDPAYKARVADAVRKSINDKFASDPAYRAACKRGGQKNKKYFSDPAFRAKHSQATKASMRKAGF